jgi:hypothetical protein
VYRAVTWLYRIIHLGANKTSHDACASVNGLVFYSLGADNKRAESGKQGEPETAETSGTHSLVGSSS